ncbi:MAG: class I SAM-dependent methyltransferase [Spirochaetia bacterium]
MVCPQCAGIEEMFDDEEAEDELRRYRRRGPRRTTRALIRELARLGVEGRTVLEVGGGVGAVHLALLRAGARSATDIDASAAFLRAAYKEAERVGYRQRISHRHGNFAEIAGEVPSADIVTLDRVICCYPDAQSLVELSAERAGSILGLVYPCDNWLSRAINWAFNLWRGMDNFKTYVHPREKVEASASSRGLELSRRVTSGFWQVAIFTRPR